MKKKSPSSLTAPREFTEADIRDYAYHLYEQSGCVPGDDLDNWLEAKACLEANIPKHQTRARLHRHRHPETNDTITIVELEARSMPPFAPLSPLPAGGVQLERIVLLENPKT